MLQLFTFTYDSPVYRNTVTLDCIAVDRDAALRKARRYLHGENIRLRRAFRRSQIRPTPIRLPRRVDEMRLEAAPS